MNKFQKLFFRVNHYIKFCLRKILLIFVQDEVFVLCSDTLEINNSSNLCKYCFNKLEVEVLNSLSARRCSVCGKLLLTEEKLCTECRELSVLKSFSGVYPIFMYVLQKKRLLYKWKIEGVHHLTFPYSKFVNIVLKNKFN